MIKSDNIHRDKRIRLLEATIGENGHKRPPNRHKHSYYAGWQVAARLGKADEMPAYADPERVAAWQAGYAMYARQTVMERVVLLRQLASIRKQRDHFWKTSRRGTMPKVKQGHCPACQVRLTPYLSKEHEGGRIKCWHCGALLDPEYGKEIEEGDEPPIEATQAHRATGSGVSVVPTGSRSGELPPSAAQDQIDEMNRLPAGPPAHPNPPPAPETQPPPSEQADPEGSKERQGWYGDPTVINEPAGPPSEWAGKPRKEGTYGAPDVVEPKANPSDQLAQPDEQPKRRKRAK